ncbi:hypothetical protein [Nocardia beijingensis]|uniref:hypothetical protein n=1 Tax=Nocardia beijingensis TaxID=95162 RepID=UPI0012F4E5E7|nr:hypothetical protein [Nocardia beijingensis]
MNEAHHRQGRRCADGCHDATVRTGDLVSDEERQYRADGVGAAIESVELLELGEHLRRGRRRTTRSRHIITFAGHSGQRQGRGPAMDARSMTLIAGQ